jgi:cyclophilin family peptidyl-prolyl cis-trans isomerase
MLPSTGAVYALSRLPKGPVESAALQRALVDRDPWTRALAARAWGKQGLPASALQAPFADRDWRVRVEAARGLASAQGSAEVLRAVLPAQQDDHVLVALYEAAGEMGELVDFSARAPLPVRCAAAVARDRVRKALVDTPGCEGEEPGWPARARAGALAAELGLLDAARAALQDPDGRVRAATAAAAGPPLHPELRARLFDADPYVIQSAAGALSKDAAGSREVARTAALRLAAARQRPAGDPESDALAALAALTGPMPQLLPTPNATLAAALGATPRPIPVPAEARAASSARRLHLRTARGDLMVDLRPDLAPLTSSALAALAQRNFYDGLTFHRVVPDFVIQGGDPRGDGDGGPGWALPDEHTPARFLRGTLGIATSGPETGGSQLFLCHSPQPHLDGRYTIAGQLRSGESVLDALQPGDTILAATAE